MATIDQEGLEEVKKVRNALEHLYSKLEKLDVYDSENNKFNVSSVTNEEYSFMFKILGQMEEEWNHNVREVFTVPDDLTINGKNYTSRS